MLFLGQSPGFPTIIRSKDFAFGNGDELPAIGAEDKRPVFRQPFAVAPKSLQAVRKFRINSFFCNCDLRIHPRYDSTLPRSLPDSVL